MTDINNGLTTANKEDHLMAALAHGMIVTNWFGILGAAVIWTLNRDKSRYVAFQAAQAAIYQIITFFLMVGCWVCWTFGYIGSLVPIMANPNAYPEPPASFWLGMASMVIPFAFMGLYVLYGIWGAVRAFQGKHFRYILIGRWLESYLLKS